MGQVFMDFLNALWPWLLVSAAILLFVNSVKSKKDDDFPDDWPQHGCHP